MSLVGIVLSLMVSAGQTTPPAPPPAPSPEAGAEQPATVVEGVTVTGRRAVRDHSEAVSEHARALASPTRRGRLALWRSELCVGVVGLPQVHGAYIAERIADEAHALGVRVGNAGCRPNVFVLVTSQPDRAAADLQDRYAGAFAVNGRRYGMLLGQSRDDLRAFLDTDATVRTWHVSRLVSSDGRPIAMVQIDPLDPTSLVPAVQTTGSSRLSANLADEMSRVYIIVDTTRLVGATYEQLASYLAMAALAQVREQQPDRRFPTILSVFEDLAEGQVGAETVTNADRAFLRGLYQGRRDPPNLVTQRGAIRRALETATR